MSVQGFSVPRLIAYNAHLRVIEMSIVEPPFILDFAQSKLDTPPDFPEGLEERWERIASDFGDRLAIVQAIFQELASRYGILLRSRASKHSI